MIHLIVTANDTLYDRLSKEIGCDGDTVHRATSVLDVSRLVAAHAIDRIFVDMALHAADTLIETLHTRPETTHIAVHVIQTGQKVPFALRRLCTDVLEVPLS